MNTSSARTGASTSARTMEGNATRVVSDEVIAGRRGGRRRRCDTEVRLDGGVTRRRRNRDKPREEIVATQDGARRNRRRSEHAPNLSEGDDAVTRALARARPNAG
jgi:hypothetical protein